MARYFVDSVGKYIGGFEGQTDEELSTLLPVGAVEISEPPIDGRDVRNMQTGEWLRYTNNPPEPTKEELQAQLQELAAKIAAL